MEDLLNLMFTEKDGLPYPNLETRNIDSIRNIILDDEDPKKEVSRRELAYVFFMCKRDYYAGFDHDEKHIHVIKHVKLGDKWKPNNYVKQALKDFTEIAATKADKLLYSLEGIAEDYLDLFEEIKRYNKSIIDSFNVDVTELTPEELEERDKSIKKAETQLSKVVDTVKSLEYVIKTVDELKAQREAAKQMEGRKSVSALETDRDRYRRKERVEKQ